jgi:hypothetical protein
MRWCVRSNRGADRRKAVIAAAVLAILGAAACSPTVKVEGTDKPIVINLNVKIEQDVRIRVEKDLESMFESKKGLF